MRLLLPLAITLALAVVLPATAAAAKPRALTGPAKSTSPAKQRPIATGVSAIKAPDGARTFTVRVRGRSNAVIVCDLDPVVCRFAKRTGAGAWEAVLPSGPVTPAVPFDGKPGGVLPPLAEAGAGPAYRVAVYTFRGSTPLRRDFEGRYLGA